jgi:hypothetical protein
MIGAVVGIFNGQPNPAAQSSDTAEAPAGPRMSGKYASAGGLQLEFHPTAVVIDCGEAHVVRPYTVQNLTDRLVITVRNGNVPVPLSLRPDGVLAGSGSIDVVGRVVTGTNADSVTYAPRSARCNVDALSPK